MTWDIHPKKCQILNTSILQLRHSVILRFTILTAVDLKNSQLINLKIRLNQNLKQNNKQTNKGKQIH